MPEGSDARTTSRSALDPDESAPGHQAPERTLSGWIDARVTARPRLVEAVLVVSAALIAWVFRFVQDDAFITFRYARNLTRGEGLVFNPGERVEGYTNFLWTLIHALPEQFGWSTPLFSQLLGVVLMVATVMVVLRLARALFGSEGFAVLVGIVLVANMTFLVYATGGMETMLQALVLTSAAWALVEAFAVGSEPRTARLIAAGACAGVAILTRLDSVVYLVPLFAAAALRVWSPRLAGSRERIGAAVRTLVIPAVPALVLVAPWAVWKLSYYGELLPNTFVAKSASGHLVPILYGVFYVATYFFFYGAFLLIGRFRRYRSSFFSVAGIAPLFSVVAVWITYTVYVGADFMEYRFFVVITPLLAMLAAWLVDRYVNVRAQMALLAALVGFSLLHLVIVFPAYPVLAFSSINEWPAESDDARLNLGQLLNREFPGGPGVEGQPVIAVGPLGVISYYSDLEAVDMLGLTDEWVARNGIEAQIYYPGHVRMAPPGYLEERGVDLIIGQPLATSQHLERDAYRLSELVGTYSVADLKDLPDEAVVVGLPIDRDDGAVPLVWPVIYLGGNAKVDAAIERNGWVVQPILRECDDSDFSDPIARRLGSRTCEGL